MREILYSDLLQRKKILSQNGLQILKRFIVMSNRIRHFLIPGLIRHTHFLLVKSVLSLVNLILLAQIVILKKTLHSQRVARPQNSIVNYFLAS